MPTVSVIMPAFNAELYLAGAVESVLRQTFADLELVIVDDGSSDGTGELAAGFARADRRVRTLRQPNAGPGPARNTAFAVASGALFAFLDSDDEWHDRFLEQQLAVLKARPDVDVLVGNAWNRGGVHDGQPSRPADGGIQELSLDDMLADEESLFIMSVFRRHVIEGVGGFDPSFLTNEEYEMWLRAAIAGFRFARNPQPLGWYRDRPDSLSANEWYMLSGILRVFAKTRPSIAPGSAAMAILDRQTVRFSAELAAYGTRASLARGDFAAAAAHLRSLRQYRSSWALDVAAALLTYAPRVGRAGYWVFSHLRPGRSRSSRRDTRWCAP